MLPHPTPSMEPPFFMQASMETRRSHPFTTQILLGFLGNSRDYGHNKEEFSNMCSEMLVSRQRKVNKEKKRPRKVGKKKEISNNPSITPIYYLIKIVQRHKSLITLSLTRSN